MKAKGIYSGKNEGHIYFECRHPSVSEPLGNFICFTPPEKIDKKKEYDMEVDLENQSCKIINRQRPGKCPNCEIDTEDSQHYLNYEINGDDKYVIYSVECSKCHTHYEEHYLMNFHHQTTENLVLG